MRRIPIYLLLMLSLVIDIMGWGAAVAKWIPPISLLVIAFWSIHSPRFVGMGTAFLIGILLDVILYTKLGHHALGYVLVAYILARSHRQMRVTPVWQQCIVVMFVVMLERFIYYWIGIGLGSVPRNIEFLYCIPVIAIVWPIVHAICSRIQQMFQVY